jgi:hypothetical protein
VTLEVRLVGGMRLWRDDGCGLVLLVRDGVMLLRWRVTLESVLGCGIVELVLLRILSGKLVLRGHL